MVKRNNLPRSFAFLMVLFLTLIFSCSKKEKMLTGLGGSWQEISSTESYYDPNDHLDSSETTTGTGESVAFLEDGTYEHGVDSGSWKIYKKGKVDSLELRVFNAWSLQPNYTKWAIMTLTETNLTLKMKEILSSGNYIIGEIFLEKN